MSKIVQLKTNRRYYDLNEAAKDSITVRELIDLLENENLDAKIVFCNDGGYTYGYISERTIQ